MLKLLITDKIDETQILPLEKYFEVEKKIGILPSDLEKIIANYHCLITRSSTAVTRKIIATGKNLKIIARAGIGVDNIDIFSATDHKIAVINAPRGNAKVTAEHTIGLLFSLFRHIPQAFIDLKRGIWGKQKYVGTQVAGKTLGIVGFGNVGREVYRIAKGVGLKILVCEPYVQLPKNVTKVTFDELLRGSDIITFHVPMTYLTQNMVNKKTINLCRDGVYIINCSRGGVVDNEAIITGLKTGKVAGFAVDVFVKEPSVDSRLLKLPNVIATPHIAGSTYESQRQSVAEIVTGIVQYVNNQLPSNLLNPQVFKKSRTQETDFSFDTVIFDCESTLSTIEGIDELAKAVGKKKEVAQLTKKAMDGFLPFDKVFEKRLALIKPNMKQLIDLGKIYHDNLVEDSKEVIGALKLLGKKVFLVSGGLTYALRQLGKELAIEDKFIFGNDTIHDANGNYQAYIEGPLRRNFGKLQIIRQIAGRKIMIGDSVTDWESKEGVDLFVGYGGVVKRKKVEEKSDVYIYHPSLASFLILAVGFEGCKRLLETKYRKFVGKGIDLLFHQKHVKIEHSLLPKLEKLKKLAYY